jgi:hypothetical protein
MAAEQRHASLAQLVEAALEDCANRLVLQSLLRKSRDRQRRQRPAAHRVNVAECVCRGDLAIDIWIVDDWREEIDRLHQRRSALPPVHTRIIRGPEIDKDPVVSVYWYGAQHLSELARGEFTRSTGAGDHLRQTLGHGSFQATDTANLADPNFSECFGCPGCSAVSVVQ